LRVRAKARMREITGGSKKKIEKEGDVKTC